MPINNYPFIGFFPNAPLRPMVTIRITNPDTGFSVDTYTDHNKKMRYQDDIFSMGGPDVYRESEAQVDGKAGSKPSTSLRSVAATQAQYFFRVGVMG